MAGGETRKVNISQVMKGNLDFILKAVVGFSFLI